MELSWMGRYRELVRALVYYSNSSNKTVIAGRRGGPYAMSQHEYQVLEYICEFENEARIMNDIALDLGIAPSNVTKAAKALLQRGFIEKYRLENNRKNIILRPTDQGKEAYIGSYSTRIAPVFAHFFEMLEGFSQDELKTIERAVRSLSNEWAGLGDKPVEPINFIKIE